MLIASAVVLNSLDTIGNSEIGLYDYALFVGLPCLANIITLAIFQTTGTCFNRNAAFIRYVS